MPNQKPSMKEAIEAILSLRRAERAGNPQTREDIASAREFLEQRVGLTVRPADAARLLGVSRPALKKWIDKREISTVVTPKGRREVPLAELLDLLEEVAEHRRDGSARPLSAVIRERTRRSTETIDIDRILPRKRPRGHHAAELHALAYHRVVAERLSDEMLDDARRRLRRWETSGRIDPRWAAEWARVLVLPRSRVAKAISADTPRARELRQTSPFAGVLSEQERRRLVQLVEERASA
jgi:predicted transcriptional regulator